MDCVQGSACVAEMLPWKQFLKIPPDVLLFDHLIHWQPFPAMVLQTCTRSRVSYDQTQLQRLQRLEEVRIFQKTDFIREGKRVMSNEIFTHCLHAEPNQIFDNWSLESGYISADASKIIGRTVVPAASKGNAGSRGEIEEIAAGVRQSVP